MATEKERTTTSSIIFIKKNKIIQSRVKRSSNKYMIIRLVDCKLSKVKELILSLISNLSPLECALCSWASSFSLVGIC